MRRAELLPGVRAMRFENIYGRFSCGELSQAVADITCYGRFVDRFVRTADGWLIAARVPVYDTDRIDPLDPANGPVLDRVALAGFAEGYRHVSYVQSLGGATLTPGLPTAGSAEESHLLAEASTWLGDQRP